MIVAHNLMAMNASRQYNMVTGYKAKSSEKLSSGYRINRAADDAAGLSISEKMRWQIRGLNRGSKNIQDGISLVQTADGALNEIHSMVHRIRELAVQAANGTNSDADRAALQSEVAQLKKEITRTFNTTDFNGMPIFRCPYVLGVADEPNDIEMFNSNDSGNQLTGSGGLIFNSKRYTWNELGANVSNGIFQDDFQVKFTDSENGEEIELSANKGDTVADIVRYYQVTSDEEGAYVNNLPAARWAETSASGKWAGVQAFDVDDTTYSFTFHGVDISFMADDGDDRDTIINRLNPDPLSTERTMYFTSKASSKQLQNAVVSQPGTMVLDVTESNKNDISSFTYAISADDTGVTVTQTNGNDGITHKKIAWSDFRNVDTGKPFPFSDWGLTDEGANPLTFDNEATYEYKDDATTDMATAMTFRFTVKDEASKAAIIKGLNGIVLTTTGVTAPLNAGGSTDNSAVTIEGHVGFSDFAFERDVLQRTFDDSVSPINGTVTRTRDYTGTVNSYVQTHTMNELLVKKITEVRDDEGELISSTEEYVALSNQQTTDGEETFDPNTGETTKWYYQTNADNDFEYYYDNGGNKESADSFIQNGIFVRDNDGTTIGNDDEHLGYSAASSGNLDQKYIYTDTGWSLDKIYRKFDNNYSYANPSGGEVLTGASSQVHLDTKDGVVDWKGRLVDTSSSTYSSSSFKIIDATGNERSYATAFTSERVRLSYTSDSSKYMTMTYNNSFDSSDGSGGTLSTIHTQIQPTDEATMTFNKARKSGGLSLRTDYESIAAPPPEKTLYIQAGPRAEQGIELTWDGMSLSTIALGSANVSTESKAKHTLDLADRAIEIVSEARSKFGAYQNRLEHAMDSVDCTSENLSAAESRIRDADMAKEIVAYGKQKVLEQVANAMLSQSNQNTSMVLQLLG